MSLGLRKQAKVLTKGQVEAILGYLKTTRHPERNKVIFLLSVRAGLRAKEIASIKWTMISDAEGNMTGALHLPNIAAKGSSGRIIHLSRDLTQALVALHSINERALPYIITTERRSHTSPAAVVNMIGYWYRELGFHGASSHSGRRTAITQWARKISTVGGSLRDVQVMAGHTTLATTQRYIEGDVMAQKRVVDIA